MRRMPVLAVLVAVLACVAARAQEDDAPPFWFEDVRTRITLPDEVADSIVRYVADRLLPDGEADSEFPEALARDVRRRVVFVSLGDGRSRARVARGMGAGVPAAVHDAIARAAKLGVEAPRALKLDIVQLAAAEARGSAARPLALEPSLTGLAFDEVTRAAFLPEELMAYGLVDSRKRLIMPLIVARLKNDEWRNARAELVAVPEHLNLYRFSAESFYTDGETVLQLYRGNRILQEVNAAQLMEAALAGGEYLLRSIDGQGRFVYTYDPIRDSADDSYNILRHAGTVYSMLELYEVTEDERLLKAARRGIDYLVTQMRPDPLDENALCVVESDSAKLGGSALAVIALARYTKVTDDRAFLPVMERLTAGMLKRQHEGGGFGWHKVEYPSGKDVGFVSEYYPGEALLALIRMHALTANDDYAVAAERGARYLIEVRDKGVPVHRLLHDHWLLYALNELHHVRPRKEFLEHAANIVTAILSKRQLDPYYPDWIGGFYTPPRSTPAATRSEGLLAAYRLFKDHEMDKEADLCLQTASLAVRFQLLTQLRPESAMYLPDPPRAIGGFRNSLTDYDIRIDYVQHNISALLALHDVLTGGTD